MAILSASQCVSYVDCRKSDLECTEHTGRLLEFFDEDLDKPICARCVIAEEYKSHKILPINELVSQIIIYFVIFLTVVSHYYQNFASYFHISIFNPYLKLVFTVVIKYILIQTNYLQANKIHIYIYIYIYFIQRLAAYFAVVNDSLRTYDSRKR